MVNTVYGYARVSTVKQSIERQVDNIKAMYPDAVIVRESYTGTKMNRPEWNKVYKQAHEGDTIVFDEVSRMSRNADEGFAVYKELYDRGVNLIFLKESTLNTENFRQTAQIAMTGGDVDCILEGVNKFLMILAEKQIRAAFETAQHEVEFLHKRTSEGVRRAQLEGKQVGRAEGKKITTKKSIEAKKKIADLLEKGNKDYDIIKITGLARNTYYKYKRELKEEGEQK